MAPLNIAWLLQSWALLGATAYSLGPSFLWKIQPVMVLWLLAATSFGQVLAWTAETVRRGPFGIWIMRGLLVGFAAVALLVQLTGHVGDVLDRVPTQWMFTHGLTFDLGWFEVVGLLVALTVACTLGQPADAARRAEDRVRAAGGPSGPEVRLARHGPARPRLRLALGADPTRHDRPRGGSGSRGALRRPDLAEHDDPARTGRL